jgi:hypothetical protein
MMKIEMSVTIDREAPTGRNPEYLWMIGNDWPIHENDDDRVNRIEVWGPELDLTRDFGNATDHADGKVRQWKRPHTKEVSQRMRRLTQPEQAA